MALVYSSVDDDKRYYLKFLRPDRTAEAGILSYLAKFDSPDNHAIRPVASRVCERGTLLLLPHAGVTVCDYQGHAHLVSFASQFLRGVAFLHEHKVAHCDLKTKNVVVDRDTGHVTLIDFDLAASGNPAQPIATHSNWPMLRGPRVDRISARVTRVSEAL